MGDCASWLKNGRNKLHATTFTLDKFHTYQALNAMSKSTMIKGGFRK